MIAAMLLCILLAGCSGKEEVPAEHPEELPAENKEAEGEETEKTFERTTFPVPDALTGEIKCSKVEIEDTSSDGKKSAIVTVYYDDPEDASKAFGICWEEMGFKKDDLGNSVSFEKDLAEWNAGDDHFSFEIRYAKVITEEQLQQYIGKYLLVESKSINEQTLKDNWEDKSYYIYIEITEDRKCTVYTVADGKQPVGVSYDLAEALDELTIEGDRITLGETEMVFQRTDEIPEPAE